MNRCRLCVIPDTRPDTPFEDGICSACRSFAKRPQIDWAARAGDFHALMRRRQNGSRFDCIVASSAGKDSHWIALKILELGYRPLLVTASTCMLTPIGRANLDNLARYADTIEVTPNREVRAKLNRLGLELVGDCSWPEHATIFNTPWSIAALHRIPLVFYGENPQEAYGGPAGTEQARQMTRRWVTEFGGFLGLRPDDLVGQFGLTAEDLMPYQPQWHSSADVEVHFMGAYFEWDSERNAKVAAEHGMKQELPCDANWWPAENLDNGMTGIHDHVMYRKYGYGRGAAQLSVDVRMGKITRDYAMRAVEAYDGLFPFTYAGIDYSRVVSHLQMTDREFWEAIARWTNWNLFQHEPGTVRPILKEFA